MSGYGFGDIVATIAIIGSSVFWLVGVFLGHVLG